MRNYVIDQSGTNVGFRVKETRFESQLYHVAAVLVGNYLKTKPNQKPRINIGFYK